MISVWQVLGALAGLLVLAAVAGALWAGWRWATDPPEERVVRIRAVEQPFDRSSMKPSVGHVVHYVSYGTPGGEFIQACRAAIVTEVELGVPVSLGGERVGLAVLNPTGIFLHSLAGGGCKYHDGAGNPGSADCPNRASHGNPMRYCACGWTEPSLVGGTWHWPEV